MLQDSSTPRSLQHGIWQISSQAWHILVHAGGITEEKQQSSLFMVYPLPQPVKPTQQKRGSFLSRRKATKKVQTPTDICDGDVELELWSYGGVKDEDMSEERWHGGWCRPSCIPISVILVLIVLVVLLPLLDHKWDTSRREETSHHAALWADCRNSCRLSLVESIPEGLIYPSEAPSYPATYDTWMELLSIADSSVEIASFYWTLRGSDIIPYPTADKGEAIFQAILKAGTQRGLQVRIVQNTPSQGQPNLDTELLTKRNAAEVRSLNFAQLVGSGVLHTKFWLIDRKHVYIGSANMDWRSLTEVKEMGVAIYNCSCLASDLGKIFDVYWYLGKKGSQVPLKWPEQFSTKYNKESPMNITFNGTATPTYLSSSPPSFCPRGRTGDIDAILDVINTAEHFVHISIMDFMPVTIYTPKIKFWPVIENALRSAAIDHKVRIRLLISHWNHSRPAETYFLRSLASLSGSFPWVQVQVKLFEVPATEEQSRIPFARVNHNKYMVTDNTAYIGTSNWSGDYFIDTAGVGVIMREPHDENGSHSSVHVDGVRQQLTNVFERDWNSPYARVLPTTNV